MDDRYQTGVDRLERAIGAYIAWQESGRADRDGLLERHADLRDLLEPMLDEYDPPSTPPLRPVGNSVTVEPGCTLGEFRLVREHASRAVRVDGRGDPELLWLLAQAHLRRGQRDQAKAAVAEAVSRMDAQVTEATTDEARSRAERKRSALQAAVRGLGL